MSELLNEWLGKRFECACVQKHEIPIRRIVIERNALADVVGYVKEAGYEEVTLVANLNTYDVAGDKLRALLEDGQVRVGISVIRENEMGEVAAGCAVRVQPVYDFTLTAAAVRSFIRVARAYTDVCTCSQPISIPGLGPL